MLQRIATYIQCISHADFYSLDKWTFFFSFPFRIHNSTQSLDLKYFFLFNKCIHIYPLLPSLQTKCVVSLLIHDFSLISGICISFFQIAYNRFPFIIISSIWWNCFGGVYTNPLSIWVRILRGKDTMATPTHWGN